MCREYYKTVTTEHVKSLGQFYTPEPVAKFMVQWVCGVNVETLYDPAFGMGAFYDAAVSNGFKGHFIADEIDVSSYQYIKSHLEESIPLSLRNQDYFSVWDAGNAYDAIVCNPPYLRFQNVKARARIFPALSRLTGEKISGYTNMASAFLLKSISELKDGARLAYIMPLEFLNAGYGTLIKEYLLREGTINNIIQIKDEQGTFDTVITTVCILLFTKGRKEKKVLFSKIENVCDMNIELCAEVHVSDMDASDKWQTYFNGVPFFKRDGFVPLSAYGKFKRGIATGANKFFTLTQIDIERMGLNPDEYLPCITRSNQIRTPLFTDEMLSRLEERNDKVFLLNLNKEQISGGAKKYVDYGESKGYNNRYLTKNRRPWFSMEAREPSPLLIGVFSRNKYKIIRNYTNAINLTCYHGFTPNGDSVPEIEDKLFIYLKSDLAKKALINNQRTYGNNLAKFEPNDLGQLLVPNIEQFSRMDDAFILRQLDHIRNYDCLSRDGNDFIDHL